MAKKSAGVFLLREERGDIVMLALAGRNSWDLPKGGIRDGETPFEAAKRELLEETGIANVSWGFAGIDVAPFSITYTLRNKTEKEVKFFLATTTKSKVSVSSEHQSFRWIPIDDAEDFLPERFHPLVEWARGFVG